MRKVITVACFLLITCLAFAAWNGTKPVYRARRVAVDAFGGGDATISPDGKRFITTSRRSGNWELWMYEMNNGEWTQQTDDPGDDFEAKWSPDGRRLVFCSTRSGQKDIWLLDLETRQLKQLTFSQDEDEYPSWSPDGNQIVYTGGPWGKRDFFVVSSAGGTPRKVSPHSGAAGACAFEPDGKSLVCHNYDSGSGDLIRLWLDNGEVTPLTIGGGWDYKPNTSPDGRWVTFSRSEESPSRICILPADGSRVRQLTHSPYDDRWPSWDATGSKLLFHRIVEQGSAIKVLNRATGVIRTLVGPEERPLQASLDPKARRLVYCSQLRDQKVLRVLDVETRMTQTLDTGPGESCFPRWSPDGGRIAFAGKRGGRWEISVIKSDGSGLQSLTEGIPGFHGMDGPVDWSPHGSKILFKSDTKPFESRIHTIDLKTLRVAGVTDGAWFDEAPSWAPDGKGIIFMSTRGGNWTWGLFQLSLSDGSLKTLAGPDWTERNFPRVTASGHMIWSAVDDKGAQYLVERPRAGKERVVVEAGPGARWPSYSKDGALIVFTSVERRVEYWIAENPLGANSPAHDPESPAAVPESPPAVQAMRERIGVADSRRSPVDMYRR